MGFSEDVRRALSERIGQGGPFANKRQMAEALNLDPSQLGRFLKGERGLTVESLGRVLDGLGARLEFPGGGDSARQVCFVSADKTPSAAGTPGPRPEDFLAVPLVSLEHAALAGLIPESLVQGWLLVWRDQDSLRRRSDLAAARVPEGDVSMAPALHPGDLVLVDRADRAPHDGGLMLVSGPAGPARIRRVALRPQDGDGELVLYSDNPREYPPQSLLLGRDLGNDLASVLAGRVLFAWSDMTRK